MLLAVAALMLAVTADAQINLNKLQKAAQGVMKQQNSSNKTNSNSSKSTWTCDKCNHSGNTGNFCAECGAKQMTAQEKQAAEQAAGDTDKIVFAAANGKVWHADRDCPTLSRAKKVKEMSFSSPCFHSITLYGKIRIFTFHIKLFDKFKQYPLTINESAGNFKIFF